MSGFWNGKRVLVTGGCGFIGSHVVEALLRRGADVTATMSRSRPVADAAERLWPMSDGIRIESVDLADAEDCCDVSRGHDVILGLAHSDGSVAFKRARAASIFRHNVTVSLNLLEAARSNDIERVLLMSSAEAAGEDGAAALHEDEPWLSPAWGADDGYAWSKRMSEFSAQLWQRQYGVKVAVARPGNVYGPRDHFDTGRARVIPNFIRQALTGEGPIVIWGSGEQVRSFLYVEDLASGLLDLTEKHAEADPVDFAGTQEISVRDLAALIVRLCGRAVDVVCDTSRPSGPDKRRKTSDKAERLLGFRPTVPLETGLSRTIDACRRELLSNVAAQ